MASNNIEAPRADWRGEQTRLQLIETAESLFAREGIDAVSLRKIGVAIGSSNTNIVGYHFGTKDDLINAIFEHRIPWLEQQRELLYQRCVETNCRDMGHLLYAMWWPLYQQKAPDGRHSYAGFLSELLRSGRVGLRNAIRQNYLAVETIVSDILEIMPSLPPRLVEERLHITSVIVLTTLQTIDDDSRTKKSQTSAEEFFFDGLNMAGAALTAPTKKRTKIF